LLSFYLRFDLCEWGSNLFWWKILKGGGWQLPDLIIGSGSTEKKIHTIEIGDSVAREKVKW
jgi:hypothetical protein